MRMLQQEMPLLLIGFCTASVMSSRHRHRRIATDTYTHTLTDKIHNTFHWVRTKCGREKWGTHVPVRAVLVSDTGVSMPRR